MPNRELKFGIRPHNWIADPTSFDDVVKWVVRAEEKGFDSVHVGDRLLSRVPPVYESTMYEATMALATFAAHTKKVQLSPLVFNSPYRHPILIAKVFASLDLMSHGRAILGVGGGWNAHEFRSIDVPRNRRGSLLEEGVEVIKRLWTENHVDHDGPNYAFKDVSVEPKPVQQPHPPIWFGSFGPEVEEFTPLVEKVLARIGRLGDGWVPLTYSTPAREMMDPKKLGDGWRRIEASLSDHGRDPNKFEMVYSHWGYVMRDESRERDACEKAVQRWFDGSYEEAKRTYLIGTADEIVDRLKFATSDLPKVDRFIFTPFNYDYEQMDRFADEVIPKIRDAF